MKRPPHPHSSLRRPDLRRPDLRRSNLRRPAVTPLPVQLGHWLRCVSSQLAQALGRDIQELGVTVSEWDVLRELYEGERRPSVLAEKLGLTRGAMSKLTQKLVANLMITQQATAPDRRGRMLALTDGGRAIVPLLASIADRTDEAFFGGLDPHTRTALVRAMRMIVRRQGLRAPGP